MLRIAVVTSVLLVGLVGCSDDSTDPPELPDPGELVEIDGPAEVDDNGGADPDD